MGFFLLFLCFSFLASSDQTTTTTATTFTIINNCRWTIWPGILSGAGIPPLDPTGFELQSSQWRSIEAPPGWSGRLWARTSCLFSDPKPGFCLTGDCGTGEVECRGNGAAPPVTLAEFTLTKEKDFYDVSLVDGYNLPLIIEGGKGKCAATGCAVDVNKRCPPELRVGEAATAAACRSACEAFGGEEFCCRGDFASPAKCRPTAYSQLFKAACPDSYSYAYDDATSIFTCAGADEYTVTFCPEATPSEMASTDSSTTSATGGGLMVVDNEPWLASLVSNSTPKPKSPSISLFCLLSFLVFFSLLHYFCLS